MGVPRVIAPPMRCPACSHENSPNARVCSACGAALTASQAESRPATAFDPIPGTGGGAVSEYGVTLPSTPAAPEPGLGSEISRFENYEIIRKEDGSLWELGRGAM